MAGFANIGEPNYRPSPSLVGPQQGSSGFTGIGISRPIRDYSGYFSPNQYRMQNSEDTSNQHQANVYMAKSGLPETGQQRTAGLADYGFSAEDWDNITRYMNNPQSTYNVDNYMKIRQRLLGQADTNAQMVTWTPEQRTQWATDFPIRMAAGYNMVPPPILQAWGIPYPSSQAGNLRY